MKIIILIILFGLPINLVFSQEKKPIELHYLSQNFLDFNVEGIDKLYLFSNNSKSLYVVGNKENIKEKPSKVQADFVVELTTLDDEYYFQDQKKDSVFFKEIVIQDVFYVKEKTPNFTWKLVEEFKIVENKKLQKATTTFRGRNYSAWCDLETPISIGPWKFNNLPGLAYSIIDESPNFYFQWHLLKITETDINKIPFLEKEKKQYIKIKDFINKRTKVYQEFEERNKARTLNISGLEEMSNESKSIDRKIRSNEIKYEWEE